MAHELLAICDACKKPVADGKGSLWVDTTEVDDATVNGHAWEQLEGQRPTPGIHSYSAESLMTYPESATPTPSPSKERTTSTSGHSLRQVAYERRSM